MYQVCIDICPLKFLYAIQKAPSGQNAFHQSSLQASLVINNCASFSLGKEALDLGMWFNR